MDKILDEADRRILRELQRDSSRPIAHVAEAVGLSHAPCWRRVQRLRADGVIVREAAILDWQKLGWELELFVFLKASQYGRAMVRNATSEITSVWRSVGANSRQSKAVTSLSSSTTLARCKSP